ncbi:hypothetical protein [Microbacterium ureisolvens]|uniref:Apea-like HEPN domain-containing protein n=1 Tax=Microbacterium ureisolvens TaxID=2781186 RepID=A0ABS7HZ74_9MICO|nr:hypothetical protein [Microbacterium ureisolvens]MBW9110149.1 hypothetical protein [Microbacterium ureisolvens]
MTDGLVRMRFIAPEAWIELELLGASFEARREGRRVRVVLPDHPEAFSALPDGLEDEWRPSFLPAGPVFDEPGRDTRTASLLIFEVTVEVDSEVPTPKPEHLTPDLRRVVERDLDVGVVIATQVAGLFLRHLRAAAPQQSWLGLATHAPEQYGIACLEYLDTGEFIFGRGRPQSTTVRSSQLRLDVGSLSEVAKKVIADEEPGVAESLLADTWHLSDASGANDRDRAWIVAAVACEVRVKRELRERAGNDRGGMVELLLRRRSNLPDLLDEVWSAVLGTSLRVEAPELFANVRSLSRQRNRIVHAGMRDPMVPLSLDPAQIARDLFEWLDEPVAVEA